MAAELGASFDDRIAVCDDNRVLRTEGNVVTAMGEWVDETNAATTSAAHARRR